MERVIVLAGLLIAHAGCSVIVHVEPDVCVRSSECDSLNTRDGIAASACVIWQCHGPGPGQPGTCVLGARDRDDDRDVAAACGGHDCDDENLARSSTSTEVCDGIDDDCDFRVDETDFQPVELARIETGAASAVFTPSAAIVLSAGNAGRWLPLTAGAFGDAAMLSYWPRSIDGPTDTGCLGDPSAQLTTPNAACDLAEAALATRDSGLSLAAVVSRTGCATGGLRVGAVVADHVEIVGRTVTPDATANTFPAIDVRAGGNCTGTLGATRPAISVLDDSNVHARALVGWLDASSRDFACPSTGAEVRVMGVSTTTRFIAGPSVTFVAGTNGGMPLALGTATSVSPPAIATMADRGWLVAYGTASSIEVSWIDALADTESDAPSLPDPASVVSLPASGARSVDLAVEPSGDVAVVWSDGCDTSGTVTLASFAIDPTSHAMRTRPTIVMLGSGGAPDVARGSDGFAADDPQAAMHGPTWIVVADRAEGIALGRVLDGAQLGTTTIATPAMGGRLVRQAGGVVTLYARDGTDLVAARAECVPPAP